MDSAERYIRMYKDLYPYWPVSREANHESKSSQLETHHKAKPIPIAIPSQREHNLDDIVEERVQSSLGEGDAIRLKSSSSCNVSRQSAQPASSNTLSKLFGNLCDNFLTDNISAALDRQQEELDHQVVQLMEHREGFRRSERQISSLLEEVKMQKEKAEHAAQRKYKLMLAELDMWYEQTCNDIHGEGDKAMHAMEHKKRQIQNSVQKIDHGIASTRKIYSAQSLHSSTGSKSSVGNENAFLVKKTNWTLLQSIPPDISIEERKLPQKLFRKFHGERQRHRRKGVDDNHNERKKKKQTENGRHSNGNIARNDDLEKHGVSQGRSAEQEEILNALQTLGDIYHRHARRHTTTSTHIRPNTNNHDT